MARPREFDETKVLEAAVRCFWIRGYEATSIRDLAEEMGITTASLYNAFGDKRSLYRCALDYYIANSFVDYAQRLEQKLPPREAIQTFFTGIIKASLRDAQRKGCLVVNAVVDVAPHDPEFKRAIADVLVQMEAFFCRCIATGQQNGSIATFQPVEDLARMLLSIALGIRVLARVRPERELLEGLVRPAFALLDNHADVKRPQR